MRAVDHDHAGQGKAGEGGGLMGMTPEELKATLPPALWKEVAPQLGYDQNAKPKRRKFGNQPVYVDGRRFDSKAEARRYEELIRLHAAGEILWFCMQPVFRLPGGIEYRRLLAGCGKDRSPEVGWALSGQWQYHALCPYRTPRCQKPREFDKR